MRSICDGERGLRGRGDALELLLARPERPSRCTFPMTALRVMPPSSAAIWLAESPSAHSFFSNSTRSSVHIMVVAPCSRRYRSSADTPDRIHLCPPATQIAVGYAGNNHKLRKQSAARDIVLMG